MNIYNEFKKAYGNHFQDLFSDLMKQKYGLRYQPVSSYGSQGDMSVDGVLDSKTAFAVYAPETYNDQKTISKLKSDFSGFLKHKKNGDWKNIEQYIFVIKRDRAGITPAIMNLISEFKETFTVSIVTMDDLKLISKGYLPFSDDGKLLEEFKIDIIETMEYIIETDFSAQPFNLNLSDEIEEIIKKWSKTKHSFKSEKIEDLKLQILESFRELCVYLTDLYVHALPDGRLLFNNDSPEAGERLRNEMQPQTYRIRCKIRDLLNELKSIK